MNDQTEEEERYLCVPDRLRHHFKVDAFADPEREQREVREARRDRSANLVATLLWSPSPSSAASTVDGDQAPAELGPLYSLEIEQQLSTRLAFDRTLTRLEEYFGTLTARIRWLEESSPVLLPPWVDDGGASSGLKLPTLLQTQRQIVNACHECLSDCDVYLGIYEALTSPPAASPVPMVRFVACSTRSSMLHRTLKCPTPSDQSVDSDDQDHSDALDNNTVAGQQHRAEQSRSRSNGQASVSVMAMVSQIPVIIDDVTKYRGSPIVSFAPGPFPTGPFACFPLLPQQRSNQDDNNELHSGATAHKSRPSAIGVLSLDSFRKARRMRPDAMTVGEVYQFLIREKQVETANELRKVQINGAQLLALTEADLTHKPAFRKIKIVARKKLLELILSLRRGSDRHLASSGTKAMLPRFFTEDPAAIDFLGRVSDMSAVFLDGYRAVHWSREMASVTRDPLCNTNDVFDVLVRGVAAATTSVRRVVVWKVVEPKHEICAIAATDVPDNRLAPFLSWEERMIKRVALYKERSICLDDHNERIAANEASSLQLTQGNVTSVLFRPPTTNATSYSNSQTSPSPTCESATFNIAWNNRTYQSLSWRQLRQLLPIRPMNPKHFQLKVLMEKLSTNAASGVDPSAYGAPSQPVPLQESNALVFVMHDAFQPHGVTYALEVDFASDYPIESKHNTGVVAYLQRAVAIAERSLAIVHGRTLRRLRRERSIATLTQRLSGKTPSASSKSSSLPLFTPSSGSIDVLGTMVSEVFLDIAHNLPGAEVQIAELQSDGTQLKYTFVGNGSSVTINKTLQRGQGVSFRCLESKAPLVIDATTSPDLSKRVRRVSRKDYGERPLEFPYVFIPLFHEDCAIGVLSIDSFHNVPKGRQDEKHPESGVIEYLVALGKLVATAIYSKRRSFALHELQQLSKIPLQSPHRLFFAASRALKDVLAGSWKVRLVEVDCVRGKTSLVYEFSEAERAIAMTTAFTIVEPLYFRWRELLPDTVAECVLPTSTQSIDMAKNAEELLVAVETLDREHREQRTKIKELVSTRRSLGVPLSSSEKQRLMAQNITDKYFYLVPSTIDDKAEMPPGARTNDGSVRMSNEKYTTHAVGLFLATKTFLHALVRSVATPPEICVFLAVSTLPQFHAECEGVFVQRVAEALARGFEACEARVERSRSRIRALSRFQATCEEEVQRCIERVRDCGGKENDDDDVQKIGGQGAKHVQQRLTRPLPHVMSPSEELEIEELQNLQRHVIGILQTEFQDPDVYIALLEPSRDVLRYTNASPGSVMKGKQLKREVGVSFDVIEKQAPVIVTRQDIESSNLDSPSRRLRYFSNAPHKWPFIAVPIGRVGVLALNNLEKYERLSGEQQPELGLVDFLRRIGMALGSAFIRVRRATRSHRQSLLTRSLLRVMKACEDRRCEQVGVSPSPALSSGGGTAYSPLFLLHYVVQQLEGALNGIDTYIGLIEPLCRCLRFVCASTGSRMEGKRVNAMHSVSFRVFASQQLVVIRDLRAHYHEFLSRPMPVDSIAGVDNSSVNGDHLRLKFFGEAVPTGTFVCVPIPFVGVLAVDTFSGAASGVYSSHLGAPPEDGVVEFLGRVSGLVGENLRAQRANSLRTMLSNLFEGNSSTIPKLCRAILNQLAEALPAVVDMHFVRFAKEERVDEALDWRSSAFVSLSRSEEDGGVPLSTEQNDAEIGELVSALVSQGDRDGDPVQQLARCPEVVIARCADTRDVDDDAVPLRSTALVLRRVPGAVWTYDAELVREVLPAINDALRLANPRIEGIVRRRMVLKQLDQLTGRLDAVVSASRAVAILYENELPAAMEMIALAMGIDTCDVYLGERCVSQGNSRAVGVLRYVATSKQSLMRGVSVDLSRADAQAMVTVQTLASSPLQSSSSAAVVYLSQDDKTSASTKSISKTAPLFSLGRKHQQRVVPLTTKAAQRVFVTVLMGDDHVLCADSLGVEALTPQQQIEQDVLTFFESAAQKLLHAIQITRWRASFEQLTTMSRTPHPNLRALWGSALSVLRRDLVRFHSMQIVRLGEDFTSDYDVAAWLGAPTRRPTGKHTKTSHDSHLCYACDCERALLVEGIHFERRVCLPMTNVPRTLDTARSSQQPAEGVEKRGAFATACFATMLDADRGSDAQWALCVFHHDAVAAPSSSTALLSSTAKRPRSTSTSQRWQPLAFTTAQRQYFFAFASVISSVFARVFRACVLDSFAVELAFVLLEQEALAAVKELVVVRVSDVNETDPARTAAATDAEMDETQQVIPTAPRVLFSTIPGKHVVGRALKGKLAAKVSQFHAQTRTQLAVFATKKVFAVGEERSAPTVTNAPVSPPVQQQAEAAMSSAAKPRSAAASLFGGRSFFKKRPGAKSDAKITAPSAEQTAMQTAAATIAPRQPPSVTIHVLLRAQTRPAARHADYVVLVVDKVAVGAATPIEAAVRKVKEQADAVHEAFDTGANTHAEINAKRFCHSSVAALNDGGGGGFLLLTLLERARERLGMRRVALDSTVRDVTVETNAETTARGGIDESDGASPSPTEMTGGSAHAAKPVDEELVVSVRAAMMATGLKKQHDKVMETGTSLELCSEYLRVRTGDALLILDPTDRRTWNCITRARSLLASAAHPVQYQAPSATAISEPIAALQAFLRVSSAVVRYLRHLEAAMTRTRRETWDTPATVLQRAARSALARRELRRRRREFTAALAIQCAFRQHLARRAKLFRQWTRAAVRIQRAYRTRRARKQYGRRRMLPTELRAVAGRLSRFQDQHDVDGGGGAANDGRWQTDMSAFSTFSAYIASRAGKAQLRREEEILDKRRRAVAAERRAAALTPDDVLWAELGDAFELLDELGTGELSRERAQELMTRVHVPLAAGEVEDVTAMMDSDGSGSISLQEFSAWLAHELPALRRRARDCGRLGASDWRWIVQESAKTALRKQWRAVRRVTRVGIGDPGIGVMQQLGASSDLSNADE